MAAVVRVAKRYLLCAVCVCGVFLFSASGGFAFEDSARTVGQDVAVQSQSAPSSNLNKNFRARIVYKSGHVEELLVVAATTNAFDNMRARFIQGGAVEQVGVHALGGNETIAVRWTEVASFYTWQD